MNVHFNRLEQIPIHESIFNVRVHKNLFNLLKNDPAYKFHDVWS